MTQDFQGSNGNSGRNAIWDRFVERRESNPESCAMIDEAGELTWANLAARIDAIAELVPEPHGKRPVRVVVRNADPCSLLAGILACWKSGVSAVVLRDSMTPAQVVSIVDWLRPHAVLDGWQIDPRKKTIHSPARPMGARDEALVVCTSGTTGTPKLVALPAESVCLNAAAIAQSLQLGPRDRVAVTTPLGYMYGLLGGGLASLWAGSACRVFRPGEPPTRIQAAIRTENLTVIQGPPSLFRLFLAYWNGRPFPGVRLLTTGGEPMGRDLFEGLEQAFPHAKKLFLYGMTEAGPRISHLAFEEGGGRDSAIGFPYGHIEWRLDKIENAKGARLVFRGPGVMLGYIAPGGGYAGLDAEGYFHSNDLLEAAPDGRLRFSGRLDRIFRSGGRLVNPEAVERVLESLPSISAAFCHAQEHPLLGLVPVAEVVLQEKAAFDPHAILEACAPFIEPHSMPRNISLHAGFPLAESGKRNSGSRGAFTPEPEAKRTSP